MTIFLKNIFKEILKNIFLLLNCGHDANLCLDLKYLLFIVIVEVHRYEMLMEMHIIVFMWCFSGFEYARCSRLASCLCFFVHILLADFRAVSAGESPNLLFIYVLLELISHTKFHVDFHGSCGYLKVIQSRHSSCERSPCFLDRCDHQRNRKARQIG